MKIIVSIMLVVVTSAFICGCGDEKRVVNPPEPGDQSPLVTVMTPEGVLLHYPTWLDNPSYAQQKQQLLDELRTATPEADHRISPSHRGVPAGAIVKVLDPGGYYAPYSPTLLAAGEWQPPLTILVAWRGLNTQSSVVPALPHELRHLLTQDPLAGH